MLRTAGRNQARFDLRAVVIFGPERRFSLVASRSVSADQHDDSKFNFTRRSSDEMSSLQFRPSDVREIRSGRSISAPPAEAYGLIAGSLTRLLNGRAATRKVDNCQHAENGTLARPMIRRRSTRRIRRNGNRSGAICSILAELSGCPVTCDR